jgi:UDP-N-acetyl-D-mannosaminuronic acid dehydrogenase
LDKLIGIGKAAGRYGISKRTLRYYEEIGVLDSIREENSNYRCYSEAQLIRLEQILLLKNLGFTMAEAGQILQSDDRMIARGVLADKLKELKKDMDALTSLKSVVETMVKISDEEGSTGFGIRRLLREHPYLHGSVERRINMKTDQKDKFVIEFGLSLVPYANELMDGVKNLRQQLESAMEKELPLVRIRDNFTLSEGEYRILVDGEVAAAGDFGTMPGKGAIPELVESFRSVVYKAEKKQPIQTISVMGLGYIGLPTAVTLALAGFEVRGFDVNPAVLESLRRGKIHIVEPGLQEVLEQALQSGRLSFWDELQPADAFYICVPTPFVTGEGGKRRAELKFVEAAASMAGKVLKPGNLVILESTVPPRTTGEMAGILARISGLSQDRFHVAHCPERVIPGRMLEELRNNDRIIGAHTPEAAKLARGIYERILVEGKVRLTDDVTAEMCKLFENTYRDVNIALANELSIIADKLDIDAFELIALANCHPRVNIMTPGVGVGGHCIAVDPWFIHERFEDEAQLIYTARMRNDGKPRWVADRVIRDLEGDRSKTICVLGLSYKADVDDLRESPSVELCHILIDKGYAVVACEPNVHKTRIDGIDNLPLEQAIDQCDYSVVTLAHSDFKKNRDVIRKKPFYDCVGIMNKQKS